MSAIRVKIFVGFLFAACLSACGAGSTYGAGYYYRSPGFYNYHPYSAWGPANYGYNPYFFGPGFWHPYGGLYGPAWGGVYGGGFGGFRGGGGPAPSAPAPSAPSGGGPAIRMR